MFLMAHLVWVSPLLHFIVTYSQVIPSQFMVLVLFLSTGPLLYCNRRPILFFGAHAVRARGTDGHRNVCDRSTIIGDSFLAINLERSSCFFPCSNSAQENCWQLAEPHIAARGKRHPWAMWVMQPFCAPEGTGAWSHRTPCSPWQTGSWRCGTRLLTSKLPI